MKDLYFGHSFDSDFDEVLTEEFEEEMEKLQREMKKLQRELREVQESLQ
jgi:predicted transcriptional regulator